MSSFSFRRLIRRSENRNVRINLRLLAILLVALGLTAGISHFVRAVQLDRNAKSLRRKAEEAYAQGNLDAAVGYQARYVTFRPREAEELVRLAEWSDENAKSPHDWFPALQQLDRALTQATTRDDLRRRAIRLAAKMGHFQDVLKRTHELRDKDAEMLAIEARANAAIGDYDRAAQVYMAAIDKAPAEFVNYAELLALCERHAAKLRLTPQAMERFFFPPAATDGTGAEMPADDSDSEPPQNAGDPAQPLDNRLPADKLCEPIVRAMIERAEPRFKAWLARARYSLARGRLVDAAGDVARARAAAPDDPEVLLMSTEIETSLAADARVKSQAELAEEHIRAAVDLGRQGLARTPSDLRFYLTLSRLRADAGLVVEAEQILREGLKVAEARQGEHDDQRPDARVGSAVMWALAGNLIQQAFPSNGSQDDQKLREAEELIEQLRRAGARPAWIDFLQARILLGKNNWDAAARRLERARGGLAHDPSALRSVDKSLADCYARLSNPDARLRVYRRAIEEDPFWIPGRLGLAETLVSLGQFDAALEQYAHALVAPVPGVAARVSQLLIRKQMALPEKQRNWDQVERVLAVAEQQAAGSPQAVMLRADVLLQQRRFDELDRLLSEALERDSGVTSYWVAMVESALRRKDPGDETGVDRAEQVLDRAREKLGDRPELRSLAIRLAVARGGSQATAILVGIQGQAGALPPPARAQVFRTLAHAWQAIGAPERGLALWQTVSDDPAADLDDHLFLADLAARASDADALQKALQKIRHIEGPGGPNGDYAEAAALIINASREKEKADAAGERPRPMPSISNAPSGS
jgi:tetratricopeptide (TPR) repeat protein